MTVGTYLFEQFSYDQLTIEQLLPWNVKLSKGL